MRLAGSVQKARDIPGEKSAAKLYNSINHELELTDDEDNYDQGEQALRILEQRFPGIADQASQVTDPPQLSRKANLKLVDPDEHKKEKPKGLRQRAGHATAIHARRGSYSRRTLGGRRFAQTGIPAAGESAAEFTMRTIGWIAGLSFLGLLLSPRGSKAIELASSGGVHALQALVSPGVDPLRATVSQQAAYRASARPIPAQGLRSAIASVDQAMTNFDRAIGPRNASALKHRAGTVTHK